MSQFNSLKDERLRRTLDPPLGRPFSQEELAQRVSKILRKRFSRDCVVRIEASRRGAPMRQIVALAAALSKVPLRNGTYEVVTVERLGIRVDESGATRGPKRKRQESAAAGGLDEGGRLAAAM